MYSYEYDMETFENGSDSVVASFNMSLNIELKENSKKETVQSNWTVTTQFLGIREKDNKIVGMVNIRHELTTDFLKNYAGHIGYGIGKAYRGKGYATEGLRLTIEKAWDIIEEEEIYISVHKDNPASLKVQQKNGAFIHREDDKEFYTRIKR